MIDVRGADDKYVNQSDSDADSPVEERRKPKAAWPFDSISGHNEEVRNGGLPEKNRDTLKRMFFVFLKDILLTWIIGWYPSLRKPWYVRNKIEHADWFPIWEKSISYLHRPNLVVGQKVEALLGAFRTQQILYLMDASWSPDSSRREAQLKWQVKPISNAILEPLLWGTAR